MARLHQGHTKAHAGFLYDQAWEVMSNTMYFVREYSWMFMFAGLSSLASHMTPVHETYRDNVDFEAIFSCHLLTSVCHLGISSGNEGVTGRSVCIKGKLFNNANTLVLVNMAQDLPYSNIRR